MNEKILKSTTKLLNRLYSDFKINTPLNTDQTNWMKSILLVLGNDFLERHQAPNADQKDVFGLTDSEFLNHVLAKKHGIKQKKPPQKIADMVPKPMECEKFRILESSNHEFIILEIYDNPDSDTINDNPTVRIQLDKDFAMALAESILELR